LQAALRDLASGEAEAAAEVHAATAELAAARLFPPGPERDRAEALARLHVMQARHAQLEAARRHECGRAQGAAELAQEAAAASPRAGVEWPPASGVLQLGASHRGEEVASLRQLLEVETAWHRGLEAAGEWGFAVFPAADTDGSGTVDPAELAAWGQAAEAEEQQGRGGSLLFQAGALEADVASTRRLVEHERQAHAAILAVTQEAWLVAQLPPDSPERAERTRALQYHRVHAEQLVAQLDRLGEVAEAQATMHTAQLRLRREEIRVAALPPGPEKEEAQLALAGQQARVQHLARQAANLQGVLEAEQGYSEACLQLAVEKHRVEALPEGPEKAAAERALEVQALQLEHLAGKAQRLSQAQVGEEGLYEAEHEAEVERVRVLAMPEGPEKAAAEAALAVRAEHITLMVAQVAGLQALLVAEEEAAAEEVAIFAEAVRVEAMQDGPEKAAAQQVLAHREERHASPRPSLTT
jgi:hypothetical protein